MLASGGLTAYETPNYNNGGNLNSPQNSNIIGQNSQYARNQARLQQQQQQAADKAKQDAQKLIEKAKELADKAKTEADKADAAAKKAKGKKPKKKEKDPDAKSETAKIDAEELDFIEMNSSFIIPGKIHKEMPDYVIMIINNEEGRLNIPRSDIRTITYSMGTRLAALQDDDYLGQYKVGLWAMEKNMYPKVIDLFLKIKDKEGVTTTDILKQLGRCYEQLGQLDKALEAYTDYVTGHPDDKDASDLVRALNEEVNPAPKVAEKAAAPVVAKVVDGLEGDGNWDAMTWTDANPCSAQKYTEPKTGNKMIYVESNGGMKDKSAFTRSGQALDLSGSKEMILKIFNAGETPINLAVAYVNAQSDYHESRQIRINATYDLDIQGRENITKITFLVYGQRPFKLYLDGLFFK
jgi:tetratricopeptide (TPR) repeat protein